MLPEQRDEVREWLYRASLDEVSADQLISGTRPVPETAVFHCQQLAEKALKAFLVSVNVPFPKIHDLVDLLALCTRQDSEFAQLLDIARALTPYATIFRYPTDQDAPDLTMAKQRLEWAKHVQTFVLDRLPPEVRT
jgi:HEPN domain-containing protein